MLTTSDQTENDLFTDTLNQNSQAVKNEGNPYHETGCEIKWWPSDGRLMASFNNSDSGEFVKFH